MILRESLGMALAFAFLIIVPQLLKKKKIWHGWYLMVSAVLLGFVAGQGTETVLKNFSSVLTTPHTVKAITVIMQIGMLSTLMKYFGVLDLIDKGGHDAAGFLHRTAVCPRRRSDLRPIRV